MARKKQHIIKSNPAKIDRLMNAVNNGYNYTVCCKYAGISEGAFYDWKKKGKEAFENHQNGDKLDEDDKMFLGFYENLIKNESVAEIKLVGQIMDAGKAGDWKASAWILERRFKENKDYEKTDTAELIEIGAKQIQTFLSQFE